MFSRSWRLIVDLHAEGDIMLRPRCVFGRVPETQGGTAFTIAEAHIVDLLVMRTTPLMG